MIWIFWRTIWSHLKTSDGPLTPLWNPLSFQTLAQYLQAVVQQGLSLVCGAFALPPCLPLITSIWAGSSRHTLLHSISDCWLMREREKGNERQRRDRKRQMRGKNGFEEGGGRMSQWCWKLEIEKNKRRFELKIENMFATWGKERMQVWPGCSPELLRLLPSVKSQLHSPLNNPPCHPSVPVCLTFFPPPSFLFIAGTPSWIPRPSLEKPCLTFLFFYSACMFCFSFTGFIILPQFGKSWLWHFRVSVYCRSAKLQRATRFRDRDGHRELVREKKYLCNESVTNQSIVITA